MCRKDATYGKHGKFCKDYSKMIDHSIKRKRKKPLGNRSAGQLLFSEVFLHDA
jgi:hypothetical protein